MTTETMTDVWEFLERPNRYAPEAQACYEWGLNCNTNSNPFLFFLDLIGWSEENYGTRFVLNPQSLGYMELDYLGDALKEYADRPREVTEWLDALMACEGV